MNQIHRIKELNLKSCQNAKNSIEKVATSIKTPLKKLLNSRFCEKELQACRIFELLREPGLLFRF